MTTLETQAAARAPQPRIQVPLCDLGLAPENLRAAEPEDADVPRLADTVRAAGLIYPPIVRKGRKGEAPFMVLDGRRRRFALLRLAAEGFLSPDHPVECVLAADRAAQAAAAVLPNAEHAPVHLADVIVAIGKLRRSRLTTAAIAEALGYDGLEVKRLEAMAHVHHDVLAAFRAGKLTLRQVRMFARLTDKARQGELAREALSGYFHEAALQSLVAGGRVTLADARFSLVSEDEYVAAGGRVKADLFGELPPEALDPQVLDECWRSAAGKAAQPLIDEGLSVIFARERGYAAPDGLEHLPFVYWARVTDERRVAFEAARARVEAASEAVVAVEADARAGATSELMLARLALARLTAAPGVVEAVLLTPMRGGLDLTFFHRPAAVEPAAEREDDAGEEDETGETQGGETASALTCRRDVEIPELEVDISALSHVQHAARTAMATRGLICDLADHPEAALIALTAHLFAELALQDARGPEASVLRIRPTASLSGEGADDGLVGGVWGRLADLRETYLASGRRPIDFVAGLEPDARMQLLAVLAAVTIDLREARTDGVRRAARAEAEEIAALCGADLSARWTPDAGFLALHSRAQLMGFLAEMGVDLSKPALLKKDELVRAVAEAAAARRWIPACLRWSAQVSAGEVSGADGDPAGDGGAGSD